jgi:hypothetical protein
MSTKTPPKAQDREPGATGGGQAAQQAPQANVKPVTREVTGVFDRHEIPVKTAVILTNGGLSRISAALAGIRTCTDLLTQRESDIEDDAPTLGSVAVHGLLSAIACCTELIDAHVNSTEPDGVIKIKGADADRIHSQAWAAWDRARLAKGGEQ